MKMPMGASTAILVVRKRGVNVDQAAEIASVLERAKLFYDDLEAPSYHRLAEIMFKSDVYLPVIDLMRERFCIYLTDANTDVAHILEMIDGSRKFLVLISMVGPYFHLAEFSGGATANEISHAVNIESDVVRNVGNLLGSNYNYLSKNVLAEPVRFDGGCEPLYRIVFSHGQDFGWID